MQEPSRNSGSEGGWRDMSRSGGAENDEQARDPGSGDGLVAPFAGPEAWGGQQQPESGTASSEGPADLESEATNAAGELDGDLVWDSGNLYGVTSDTPSAEPSEPWEAPTGSVQSEAGDGDETWLTEAQDADSESSNVMDFASPSGEWSGSDDGTEEGSGVLDLSLEAEALYEPSTGEAEADEPPADAPWDALGQAVDDALLRASEGAVVTDEFESQEHTGGGETDADIMPTDTRDDAEAIAARLEGLATRLRSDGVQALNSAIHSDDREEAMVAAFLAGMRGADRD